MLNMTGILFDRDIKPHQDYLSMNYTSPYTPTLYSRTDGGRGIQFLCTFDPKH